MPLKLKLLAGAALAGLSFGAGAQMAPQAQQPAGGGSQALQQAVDQATQANAQTSADASATDVKPVTAADIKKGDAVNDTKGNPVGKIESVSGNSAVVSTGAARAQIPVSSLGKNDKGLVIAMTKSEFNAAAKKKEK